VFGVEMKKQKEK